MGKSNQRGWLSLRGKKWYGFFRRAVYDPISEKEKLKKATIILGTKSQLSKREAQDKLQSEMTKVIGQNHSGRTPNDSAVSFGWFVRNRYYPLKEATWKEETAKVKKMIIQRDLIDYFDTVPLENFEKFILQVHLNNLAKTRSRDRVLQIRAYIRDIFSEVVDQDFLSKDPARKIKVPAQLRETDTTMLSWEQLRLVLSKLSLRDRIILELDMTNALRPGELFAIRWKCFNRAESAIRLVETVYKGQIRSWGKTKKSLAVVHIPKKLSDDLWLLKAQAVKSSPEGFIFPNADGGFMDPDNYRKRTLHKLAQDLKLPKLTFQVIRRTIATLAQKKGTVKDVQGLLRHSRAATTTDVYMQEIPESVRATIDAVSRELRRKPKQRKPSKRNVNLRPNAPKLKRRETVSC
ncbi:MAG TPA: tyrosine-type recombinase/integrase [Candidatus Angelobacter sp.]|jgi:integrase